MKNQEEFIEERIQQLKDDNKLCFKQTNEIVEYVYLTAVHDLADNIGNSVINYTETPVEKEDVFSIQKKLDEKTKQYEEAIKEIDRLESELVKIKASKPAKGTGKFSDSINKYKNEIEIIDAKLEVYNKVYDWISINKKDLLSIYMDIKEEISTLNHRKEILKNRV